MTGFLGQVSFWGREIVSRRIPMPRPCRPSPSQVISHGLTTSPARELSPTPPWPPCHRPPINGQKNLPVRRRRMPRPAPAPRAAGPGLDPPARCRRGRPWWAVTAARESPVPSHFPREGDAVRQWLGPIEKNDDARFVARALPLVATLACFFHAGPAPGCPPARPGPPGAPDDGTPAAGTAHHAQQQWCGAAAPPPPAAVRAPSAA